VIEDVEMITEGSTFIESNYREFMSLSDMDETIIREAELDILTLGDNLSGIYDESGLSSKKRKRDINICGCDPSVFIAWKKNIISFSFRAAIIINKSFLGKPI